LALSVLEEHQDDLDRHVYRQERQASDGLSRGELDSRHGADQVVKKCLIPGYVIADEFEGNVIDLEGAELVVVEVYENLISMRLWSWNFFNLPLCVF
jgi:hypothetical protein